MTAWFKLNRDYPSARCHLYTDIPYHFVFERDAWKTRERHVKLVPRMYTVSVKDEELFYLRMLLLHVRGATSFEDVRTIQRHLLATDVEWEHCLDEAVVFQMPPQMRHTFAYICTFGGVTDASQLWEKFKEHMIIDFLRHYDENESLNLALHDLESVFQQHGLTCSHYGLPQPVGTAADVLTYDQQQEMTRINRLRASLNPEQRNAFEHIVKGVNNPAAHKLFYLNGPGGSGKTYLYTTLISFMRSRGLSVLPFASTGIAATLMEGGRTVHSGFGIPYHWTNRQYQLFEETQRKEEH